jgi:hypothetical protein
MLLLAVSLLKLLSYFNMKAAFTICANNYMASAKVLKGSFNKYHPDIPFHIILVDKPDAVLNCNSYDKECIKFIDEIVKNVDDLSLRFNISELCTTVKPYVFEHLFKTYTKVVYLDPDIKIYAPLTECWKALQTYTFALTPHLMSPVDDGKIPSDFYTLRTGIFNLGFIGISLNEETPRFLKWWGDRLLKYGYSRWDEGMFYDQIWANYIPVMFPNYYIIRHPGYNVANWNWHERMIAEPAGSFMVNADYPLVFFHFSSYKYADPATYCKYNTRYNRNNRTDLATVFDGYYNDLTKAGQAVAGKSTPFYQQQYMANVMKIDKARPVKQKIKRKLIKLIEAIF